MSTELPFRTDGTDFLKRLAREVESLKRHTHVDPDTILDETDFVPPMPPTDPIASSDWQADGARVAFSWTAPEYDTANAPLDDLSHYELRWQYQSAPGWHTVTTDDVTATILGFTGSETLDWQVRALDVNGNASDWLVDTVATAADPTPPSSDTLAPKPPTALSGTGTVVPGTVVTVDYELTWTAPTENVDNSPLTDLMDYEVQHRYVGSTTWTSFTTPLDETLISGLEPSIDVEWRVRARDTSGNVSTWATDTITGIDDGTPPDQPSVATLTTKLGTVTATWNGLDVDSDPMPSDFSHLDVYVSDTTGFTPSSATYYDRLVGPGSVVVTGLTVGDTVYIRTIAVDTSGNQSPASAEVSLVVQGVQGPDLEANSVTSNAIAAGAITAEKIALGVLRTNLIADPSFEEDYAITGSNDDTRWYVEWAWAGPTATRVMSPRSGQRALEMTVGVGAELSINSAHFDLEPGETYVLSVYVATTTDPVTTDFAIRVAGGTDDNLTEYPAGTLGTALPLEVDDPNYLEDLDVVYSGATVTPESYGNYTARFMVPAGIVRGALQLRATGGSAYSLIVDDVSVVKLGQGATEITSAGIRLFGSEGTEVGAFVSNRANYFSVTGPDGETLASVSEDGDISGQTVYSENDIQIGGQPLIGSLADFQPITDQPENIAGWMDPLPRGIVGHGFWNNGAIYDFTTTRGIFELAFAVERGRAYRVTFYGGYANNTGSAASGYEIRLTNPTTVDTEAATPDFTNSSRILRSFISSQITQYQTPPTVSRILRCNVDDGIIGSGNGELNPGVAKLFVTVTGATSTIRYSANEDLVLFVEDVGPDHPNSKRNNYTESGSGATTTPTTKTYVKEWSTSDSRGYKGSGAQSFDQSVIKHGYESYEGNSSGAYQFNYSSIQSALSTAGGRVVVIKKVEVYLYASHWYYNSGGTAYLRTYNATSLPTTRPTAGNLVTSANWPKPGGRWVNVGTAWGSNFQDGSAKGVLIGNTGSTSSLYYGRFSKTAKLRITYTVTE